MKLQESLIGSRQVTDVPLKKLAGVNSTEMQFV